MKEFKCEGFLLTRHWRDTSAGIDLEFWFSSDNGPLQVLVKGQESVCFLLAADDAKARQVLANEIGREGPWRIAPVELYNHKHERVSALYCQNHRVAVECQRHLQTGGIEVWEGDIRSTDRYLMERFITGGARIHSTNTSGPLVNPQLFPSTYKPRLNVISVDIETSMDGKQLYSIASYDPEEQVVFMVGKPQAHQESIDIRWLESERQCLESFSAWLAAKDPDVLIGWSVVQFDCWVLECLCRRLNIKPTFGRGGQTWHWRQDGDGGRRYLSVPGRVVLDGIELLKTATYQFDSFSLEAVSQSVLGQGKLLQGSGRGKEISGLYTEDQVALARYNLKDCQLVWDIFDKTQLIDFAVERSQVTGMALDRSGGSVAAFDYAYLPRLHRKGYVAPNLGELASDIHSPGGYVMDSRPGIYEHVLVLDFKSLYPSIIRTFKIDPYGFWYAQHQHLDDKGCVPGFHGARFSKAQSLLPSIIETLWQARDQAKRQNNQALSQAIKIIMNSFYGVLGSPGCRFFDPRVCSSITLRGHEIIQRSRDWIEERGYRVIYGDTDSVFVWIEDPPGDLTISEIGKALASGLNQWWQQVLQEDFAIESALEIEFETHFLQFFMPTIRGSEQGSKKRYAGTIRHAEGEVEQLVFKGLENVRTDWTPLAKDFQYELYRRIFSQQPVERFIEQTFNDLLAGKSDHKLVYRKRLRRKVHEYKKNVPPHVQAARQLQLVGVELTRGDWVEYLMTTSGPYPLQLCAGGEHERTHKPMIDYQLYVDRQLKPVADSILQFIGTSFNEITDRQLRLFSELPNHLPS